MKRLSIVLSIVILTVFLFGVFNLFYPLKYKNQIVKCAEENNVDPPLIAAVINAESGFVADKISKKGAIGLMQVMPSTAQYITVKLKLENKDKAANLDLFDCETNIRVGVAYLSYLIKKFGDTDTALFAYNAGEGNVGRWLKDEKITKLKSCPFDETNAYVKKIKKSIKFYKFRI
ncbi:MAG: lytic transglycosylase domain-containing protein [Christensenellaceae bacterium]|jgi:soluble lytic murein transglycosylase|nr:lytic transglycosylase domain-containing protein [Christensenellaceae bacterium]